MTLCVCCGQAAFCVAAALRTDKFYDALGSSNFIAAALATFFYGHYYHARQIVVTVFVCCWALRLGSFLFYRVLKSGGDSRFKDIKDKPRMCPFFFCDTCESCCEVAHTVYKSNLHWAGPFKWHFIVARKSISSTIIWHADKFFIAWTFQAAWVFTVLLPVAILNGTDFNPGEPNHCGFVEPCG